MKIGLNKRQYELITELVKKEIDEQGGDTNSEPNPGTSQTQSGGTGYPEVGKWESGVTRGPANQIKVTKWSDVVGSTLKRSKANQLKESILSEQIAPFYSPKFENGKIVGYEYDQGGPLSNGKPKGSVDVSSLSNSLIKDPKNPPKTISYQDMDRYYWSQPRLDPKIFNANKKETYLGKKRPTPPTPSYEYLKKNNPSGTIMTPERSKKIQSKNRFGDFIIWSYDSLVDGYMEGYQRDLNQKFEFEDDMWLQSNRGITKDEETRYFERKTSTGESVPKGFDPKKYPEYLSKKSPLENRLKVLTKKVLSHGKLTDTEIKEVDFIKEKLIDLKNEYWSPLFSYGITPEEKKLYDERIKEAENQYREEYKNIFGNYPENKVVEPNPNAPKIDNTKIIKSTYVLEDPKQLELLKNKNETIKNINFIFGKDDWYKDVGMFGQAFDEWWDKYGTIAQIIGNVAIVVASGGIAGFIEGAAIGAARIVGIQLLRSGTVRAMTPYVADALFNSTVGTYQMSRNDKIGALISLMCTVIPFVSYAKNVGKISVKESEGLLKLLNTVDFGDAESMRKAVASMSDTQRYVFRNAMSLSKEGIKANHDILLKIAAEGFKKSGVEVAKAPFRIWAKPIFKVFAFEGGPPTLVNFIDAFANLFPNMGITFTPIEMTEIKNFLKEELKNLTVPQVIHITNELSKPEKVKNIKNVEDLKSETVKQILIAKEMNNQDLIEHAKTLGLPEDFYINLKKYENVSIVDIMRKKREQESIKNNTEPVKSPNEKN